MPELERFTDGQMAVLESGGIIAASYNTSNKTLQPKDTPVHQIFPVNGIDPTRNSIKDQPPSEKNVY